MSISFLFNAPFYTLYRQTLHSVNMYWSCICTAPISRLMITTDNSSVRSSDVLTERRGGSVDPHGARRQRQLLTFVAGQPLPHVRCVAAGGFPPPAVSVFLDHRDITYRFNVVQRSSLHGVHGLQVSPTLLIVACQILIIFGTNIQDKNWIGHTLRGNSLLRTAHEGKVEGKRTRGKPRIKMLDRIMTEGHTKLSYNDIEICGTRQTEMASSLPGPANSGRELRRRFRKQLAIK